jgi:hypothetical protein
MTEVDFIKFGFVLMGNGELHAPPGTRVTLLVNGPFVQITLSFDDGKSLEAWVSRAALKVQHGGRENRTQEAAVTILHGGTPGACPGRGICMRWGGNRRMLRRSSDAVATS